MTVSAIEHVLVLSDDIDAYPRLLLRRGRARGRRTAAARVPGLLAVRRRRGAACVHIAERRPYAAHAAGLGLRVPERDPGVGPVDHIAFTASDYEAVTQRLERCGVPAVTNAVPGGPRQVFVEDPNGVRVEINVRS